MKLHSMSTLFNSGESAAILGAIKAAIERSDEAPFWQQKTLPYCEAILSVLIPLREQTLLFDPEGNPAPALTMELFLRWCDLMSLKTLAFTLAKSNTAQKLMRTKYDAQAAAAYLPIDLETLGTYLSGYTVNLSDESIDFPITNYNLHIGMTTLVTNIFNGNQ
ncbi:MAG: hypothetical protein Q8K81_02995 [Sulfuricurvum sp.]|nr:hypothetical protein [Sulfuricurvum sp.]